jgi:O-antigen ligase
LGIFWAIVFFGLILLSRSKTTLIVQCFYLGMFIIYVAWARSQVLGYALALLFALILAALGIALYADTASLLDLLGKDATLTGRTDIWGAVIELVAEKPLLGWGYSAMFVPGDPTTNMMWGRMGGWQVSHAHSSWLEMTLELGLVGLFSILTIVGSALSRGLRCCVNGIIPLGYFSLVFFLAQLMVATDEAILGEKQDTAWLMFVMLTLACGEALALKQRKGFVSRYLP